MQVDASGNRFKRFWQAAARPESSAPLGLFRIVFGLLVVGELLDQTLLQGFMVDYYFDTTFHFSYYGFGWLPQIHGAAMQVFVLLLGLSFLLFALGFAYRIVKWTSFLGFSYLFLLERAAFLNHWYLIVLISFFFVLVPAHQRYSLDVWRKAVPRSLYFPRWMRGIFLLQAGLVYLLAGLAKIEPDWLTGGTMDMVLNAMGAYVPGNAPPGALALGGAWGSMALELLAFPLLLWRPSRKPAFLLLLAFHLTNFHFFTIGTFPLVMIFLNLLFIPQWFSLPGKSAATNTASPPIFSPPSFKLPHRLLRWGLVLYFALQVALPLRHHLYPGNTLWTEDGRLFSWDMFLAFKGGQVIPRILAPSDPGLELGTIPSALGLTPGQANKIFKSPDLILQFAYYLGAKYERETGKKIEVYMETSVLFNGREARKFHLPNVDLYREKRNFIAPYWWVLPLKTAPLLE